MFFKQSKDSASIIIMLYEIIIIVVVLFTLAFLCCGECCAECCAECCNDDPVIIEEKTDSPIHHEI